MGLGRLMRAVFSPMRQTCIEPERAFKHLWQASRTEEISQHLRRNFIERIGRCLPAAKRLCEKGNRKNWAESRR